MTRSDNNFLIVRIENDFPISDFENDQWRLASEAKIARNWDGSIAASGRHFGVSAIWSDTAFYVRFVAMRTEPLVISDEPILDSKTMNLWDRDVCEIFIAPDRKQAKKYFEFEVAPTGEWIDLAVDLTSGERVTDWNYHSGIEAGARIENNCVVMPIKIPWTAFGRKPEFSDVWLGNIFRCVGNEPNRGYLAWRPTGTETPNFHVPERFGEFRFEA